MNKKIILYLGVILPMALSLILSYLIFGNLFNAFQIMFDLRGRPTVTKDAIAALFMVVMFLLGVYGFLSTTLFSYLVWKVGERTLEVTEQSKQIEEKRDQEMIQESALIVQYDIERALSNLLELYNSLIIRQDPPYPSQLIFSEDWNKNIATLRGHLLGQELRYVYRFFEDFFMLQSKLDSWSSKKENHSLKSEVKRLADKYLIEATPTPLILKFGAYNSDVFFEEITSLNLFIVFRKIRLATYPSKNIVHNVKHDEKKRTWEGSITLNNVPFYQGSFDEDGHFHFQGQLFNSQGDLKSGFIGHFYNGIPRSGCRESNFREGLICRYQYKWNLKSTEISCIQIIDHSNPTPKEIISGNIENGLINNGYATLYSNNGNMTYQGSIINGKRHGDGKSFKDRKLQYYGTWNEDHIVNGKFYEDEKLIFEGSFKNDKPWNGLATNLNSYEFADFTGIIKNGKPFKGQGHVFYRNQNGQTLIEYTNIDSFYSEEAKKVNPDEADGFFTQQNNELRKNKYWVEYIYAEWVDGEAKLADHLESNLIVKSGGKTE